MTKAELRPSTKAIDSGPGPSSAAKSSSTVESSPSPETNVPSPMEVSSTTTTTAGAQESPYFSQPETNTVPPGLSLGSVSVGAKEKYDDLSEESPEEGESKDD